MPVPDTATWEQFLQQVCVLQICAPYFSNAKIESLVELMAHLTAWLAAKVQTKLKLVGVESIHLASVREASLRQRSKSSSQPLGAKRKAAPAEWRAGDTTG